GHAVEDARRRRGVAQQIAELLRRGHRVVVVHGGGKLLTETLARLNIPTKFRQGLRVTDAATRDVALMVLAGIINKQWVAELQGRGVPALGICGGDANLIEARKLRLRTKGGSENLGFVGRPRKVNPRILEVAFREGLVPVVASLALGPRGEYLNVNAHELAAALAIALKADRLAYLTESGVGSRESGLTARDSATSRLTMNLQEIAELEKKTLVPTYDRLPILAVRGEGCYLYDDRGKKYLDFLGGLAVNALGYGHPEILAVLRDESESLLHVSNLLYHRYQAPLAQKLASLSGLDRVFFANSGAEVTEG